MPWAIVTPDTVAFPTRASGSSSRSTTRRPRSPRVSDLLRGLRPRRRASTTAPRRSARLADAAGALVVRHAVNLGQGAALQTGFDYVLRHTDAAYCVTFDADGQHRVEDAQRMVQRAKETGVDVVLASRFRGATHDMPRLRGLVLRAGIWFTRLSARPRRHRHAQRTPGAPPQRASRHPAPPPRMAYASELLPPSCPPGSATWRSR